MDVFHIIPTTNHGGNETFARCLIENFPSNVRHKIFSTSNIDGLMANDFKLIGELNKLNTCNSTAD